MALVRRAATALRAETCRRSEAEHANMHAAQGRSSCHSPRRRKGGGRADGGSERGINWFSTVETLELPGEFFGLGARADGAAAEIATFSSRSQTRAY